MSRCAFVIFVIKRSLSPGFAGIPNPLFAMDNTMMFFADGKDAMQQLINGSFVGIGQEVSDAFGITLWTLVQGSDYRFSVVAPGFGTKEGNFTRTTNSYVVSLDSDNTQNFISYLDDFSFTVSPTSISQELTNFSITTVSALGKLEWFSVSVFCRVQL